MGDHGQIYRQGSEEILPGQSVTGAGLEGDSRSRFVWCLHRSDGAETMFGNHCKPPPAALAAGLGCQLSLGLVEGLG